MQAERPQPQREQPGATPGRRRGRLERVLHVFSDGKDEWVKKRKKAEKIFRRFAREHGSARIYEERYKDRENDDMVSETYIKGIGDYPS
jgi:hypothetical protein